MISLYVDVPSAGFRKSHARTYGETYRYPPPSTVYGMLLSLVGEWERERHVGVKLSLGLHTKPNVATRFAKLSRFSLRDAPRETSKKKERLMEDGVTTYKMLKPPIAEHVEFLVDLKLTVCVDSSEEEGGDTLERRIESALENPKNQPRSGILCLGLSDDMVNDVRLSGEAVPVDWLVLSDSGRTELPVWVDHGKDQETRWRRFTVESGMSNEPPVDSWVKILTPNLVVA